MADKDGNDGAEKSAIDRNIAERDSNGSLTNFDEIRYQHLNIDEEQSEGEDSSSSSEEEDKELESKDNESDSSDSSNEYEEISEHFAAKLSLISTDHNITRFANLLRDCKNIIVMTGAGISTAAGIPDFRTPKSGLYANLQKYKLPYPEAIFELSYFRKNPSAFFTLAREMYPNGRYKPTISHAFIKLLEEKKLLIRNYTQNIDTLERVAGISDDLLVEAHGSFHAARCIDCLTPYDHLTVKERIFECDVLECESCKGLVKPNIVFFGENLPPRFHSLSSKDFKNTDLVIIMGTSLKVHPFASLVTLAPSNCPRVLINRDPVGVGLGLDFLSPDSQDIFISGDCDDICTLVSDSLGWRNDLKSIQSQF